MYTANLSTGLRGMGARGVAGARTGRSRDHCWPTPDAGAPSPTTDAHAPTACAHEGHRVPPRTAATSELDAVIKSPDPESSTSAEVQRTTPPPETRVVQGTVTWNIRPAIGGDRRGRRRARGGLVNRPAPWWTPRRGRPPRGGGGRPCRHRAHHHRRRWTGRA